MSEERKQEEKRKAEAANKYVLMVKRLFSAQAVADLDRFLDRMPMNVGKVILGVAACVWLVAGASLLIVFQDMQALNKMKLEAISVEALVPKVPTIVKKPIDQTQLNEFIASVTDGYSRISFSVRRSGQVDISSPTTAGYKEFRRFVDHIHYGGRNWRADIQTLCIGRQCKGSQITAALLVSQVRVSD